MAEIGIGITGCGGRMGRMLIAEIQETEGCRVAGGVAPPGSSLLGRDLGELAGLGAIGLLADADGAALFRHADVVIDFTLPAVSLAFAREAARQRKPLVIGTTGFDESQHAALREAANSCAVVWAPNMSPAVTLLQDLVREAARKLGPDYDIEIVEMHHRHKIDAPSGTALALGRAAAEGRGIDLAGHSDRGRDGRTGARRRGDIGFASLRGGDVVGEHTVIFAAEGERLEFTHRATSRRLFARGAVLAARWAVRQRPGLYGMREVLGLSS